MSRNDEGRSVAEWVTLAASCLVLAVVVGLIALQIGGTEEPAAPVADVAGDVRVVDGQHHVPVVVHNTGDLAAANVQVTAELEVAGRTATADQTIDSLAGGEEVEIIFVFEDDPAAGELTVTVAGYATA